MKPVHLMKTLTRTLIIALLIGGICLMAGCNVPIVPLI